METRAKSTAEFRSEVHDLIANNESRLDGIVAKNDTRYTEIVDVLARSDTCFEQLDVKIDSRFEQLMNEMQALRLHQNPPVSSNVRSAPDIRSAPDRDPTCLIRPTNFRESILLDTGEASHSHSGLAAPTYPNYDRNNNYDRNATNLKLNFPTYGGPEDPTGWIFKAEQYFEFKGIAPHQQVQLAYFHLERVALQWYRWFTKYRGPLSWSEFTKAL